MENEGYREAGRNKENDPSFFVSISYSPKNYSKKLKCRDTETLKENSIIDNHQLGQLRTHNRLYI